MPVISAIVCTHNRADYLGNCIDSLLRQTIEADQYEILVIDNGSTDNTEQVCLKYSGESNFRYIHEPVPGLSQARNTGLQEARGQYVGYIDDDAAADPCWLEKALESFRQKPEPDWVGGAVTLVWEKTPPAWLTEEYYSALGWVDWGKSPRFLDPDREWLVGCNSLFRRQTLVDIGGFDVRLGRKKNLLLSGEELQVHHQIKAAGGNFYYHPEVHVRHYAVEERITPSYFYRRYYWGGITDYIMSRTLKDIPSQITAENDDESSRLSRLTGNVLNAIGLLVPEEKKIQSRIYMSYVAGQMIALIKYGWRTMETRQQ